MIEQTRMSVPSLAAGGGAAVWSGRPLVPVDANWNDVWLAVTPVWAVLAAGRAVFYALERIRYPAHAPPVTADAVEALLLWPFAVLGCYLTLQVWRQRGLPRAGLVALLSSLIFGSLAQPAYGVLYLSSTAAVIGYFSFKSWANERRLRNAYELEAGLARLRTLRAQINPHFLFNSLNSIVSLSDAQPATQLLVTQLSDLLRRTLQASEQEEHQLYEELTFVEEYLEIEQTRQPSRIDWQINVAAGCARAAIPSLLLVPLVENAVTHGLRGAVRTVAIHIDIWRTRNGIFIEIGNTCSDSTPPRDLARSGLGLRNVESRLDMLFGRAATFRADLTGNGRFEVQIVLPLREVPATQS
jgi:hypothetical protein